MCDDENDGICIQSSKPLISRLDRLDSLMKYLEGKQNSLIRWSDEYNWIPEMEKRSRSLDSAICEVNTKGSVLDRIASLENRLFQLCLEIEASNASCSSRMHASGSGSTSSSQGSTMGMGMGRQILRNHDNHQRCFHRGVLVDRFHFSEKSVDHAMKNSDDHVKHLIAKTKDDDRGCVRGVKYKIHKSRWKRLLGC